MTSEAVMHPDDECRPVAWQPSNAFSELMGSPVTPTPPPLQPGDAVWVRAVVKQIRPERDGFIDLDVHDFYYVSDDALDASDVEEIHIRVPAKSIRRIEGEVKP